MPPFLCVPRFHRELTAVPVHGAGLCKPWLARSERPEDNPLVQLPLTPREAEACLREWRGLDADALGQALARAALEQSGDDGLRPGENRALEAFCGRLAGTDADAWRRRAQRLLLLVWVQEERLLEMDALAGQCSAAEARLSRLLADDDMPPALPADLRHAAGEAALLPPWRFVLRQLAWFLPQRAVLCVTDADMRHDLEATGRLAALHLDAVPGAAADPAVPLPAAWRGARFTLKELLGHTPFAAPGADMASAYLFAAPETGGAL